MKEIEVLVTFDNTKEEVLNILEKFEYEKDKEIYDTYYVDELRDNLKPEENLRINEILRIRRSNEKCFITYKKNHFEGNRWLYSDKYETMADDYKMMEKIVESLGLVELIKVYNKRKVYSTGEYEIVFEDVEGLGLFMEVEKVVGDEVEDVMKIKEEIRDFIRKLGLNNVKELDLGKNQLMLRKKLNRTDIDIYVPEVNYN